MDAVFRFLAKASSYTHLLKRGREPRPDLEKKESKNILI
jgi:hypothetical protein